MWNRSASRLERVAHAWCLRFWITRVFYQHEVYLLIMGYEMTQSSCKKVWDSRWGEFSLVNTPSDIISGGNHGGVMKYQLSSQAKWQNWKLATVHVKWHISTATVMCGVKNTTTAALQFLGSSLLTHTCISGWCFSQVLGGEKRQPEIPLHSQAIDLAHWIYYFHSVILFNFQTLFFFSYNCEDVINNYVVLLVLHVDWCTIVFCLMLIRVTQVLMVTYDYLKARKFKPVVSDSRAVIVFVMLYPVK